MLKKFFLLYSTSVFCRKRKQTWTKVTSTETFMCKECNVCLQFMSSKVKWCTWWNVILDERGSKDYFFFKRFQDTRIKCFLWAMINALFCLDKEAGWLPFEKMIWKLMLFGYLHSKRTYNSQQVVGMLIAPSSVKVRGVLFSLVFTFLFDGISHFYKLLRKGLW